MSANKVISNTNNNNNNNNNNNKNPIIESKYPRIAIPLVPISRFLIEKLRSHSNRTFLIDNETKISYTFNTVADDSLRMANVLVTSGLKFGQHFGICGHNNYEFVVTLIGGLIVGGVVVPVNPNTQFDQMSQLIKDKDIKFMTVTTKYQKSLSNKMLSEYNKGIKTIVSFKKNSEINNNSENNNNNGNNSHSDDQPIDDYQSYRSHITSHKCHNERNIGVIQTIDPKVNNCLLVDTNGSFDPTKVKSCFITDFSLVSQLTMSSLPVTGFNWSSADTVVNTTPFAHINGLIQLFAALTTGSRFVITDNSQHNSYRQLCEVIEEWQATAAMLTPHIITDMIKDDNLDPTTIGSLDKVICTGASLHKNIGHKFANRFSIKDFRQAYGMTEMCGFATIEPIKSTDYDTCGIPVPAVSIKIVDTDSDRLLGPTQMGEVYVKSVQLCAKYLTPVSSESTVNVTDSDGWFRTQDIGYYDHRNKLQIIDPIDDFIQYRGLHISPTTLESILLSHSMVKEVTIFGNNHRLHGQTPGALVVLRDGDSNGCDNTVQMLKDYINEYLQQQNITVDELYVVDDIPKTISGKVNRRDVRKFVNETISRLNVADDNNNDNYNNNNKFIVNVFDNVNDM
ncbi:luciferin 4-monooxygenase-like [Oppia nitens]|uniref:luciferin 4-monooxygenase-like n=1 Tax=Oppia nitens TaxID=1686743 RepID=UPI0023DA42E0|nr:luciferin 4-monooxygenase-like [Oppia nitens]